MYQGYRSTTYFWEFVNISRKILLLSFNVFLSQYPTIYKGGFALTVIIIIYRIQIKLKPYALSYNNE